MKKGHLAWISLGCLVLYLIPNIIYFLNVNNGEVSSKAEQWGQYGDYLGGSINPILTIANILAVVYLTYIVSHLEEKRATEQMNIQKIIALNQMRFEEIKEITKILNSFTDLAELDSVEKKYQRILNIKRSVNFFAINSAPLFNDVFTPHFDENYYNKLIKSIDNFRDYLKANATNIDKAKTHALFTEYVQKKGAFLRVINNYLIQEMK